MDDVLPWLDAANDDCILASVIEVMRRFARSPVAPLPVRLRRVYRAPAPAVLERRAAIPKGSPERARNVPIRRVNEAGYLTTSEVAKLLGIGTTTLRRWEGILYQSVLRVGNVRAYTAEDVEGLRASRRVHRPERQP